MSAETYQLTRRRGRRTLSLRLTPDGSVQVSAPRWAPRHAIDEFLRRQAVWIARQRERLTALRISHPPKRFESGEFFWLDGAQRPLEIVRRPMAERVPQCESAGGGLRVTVGEAAGPEIIREALRAWYRERTLEKVGQAVADWTPRLGVAPKRVSVGDQKSRWGSCSSRGSLRFNWRLTLMPPELLDYVVVHELAHLKLMNDSPAFWKIVDAALPDYKSRRTELRRFGRRFGIDGFA